MGGLSSSFFLVSNRLTGEPVCPSEANPFEKSIPPILGSVVVAVVVVGFVAVVVPPSDKENPVLREPDGLAVSVAVAVVFFGSADTAGTSGREEPKLKSGHADSVLTGVFASSTFLVATGESLLKFKPSLPFLKLIEEAEFRTGVAVGVGLGDTLFSLLILRLGGVLG